MLVCTFTYNSFCEQTLAFHNNPYIIASHQAALIVHVSIKVLVDLGSDVGIIIEGRCLFTETVIG